jgi:glutamate-1-semialdehyde 2,1-aminomutase
VCLAAARATLAALAAGDGAVYRHLFALGRRLAEGIARMPAALDAGLRTDGPGPMLQLRVGGPAEVRNAAEFRLSDRPALGRLVAGLRRGGVRVLERGLVYLSAAHTEADVDRVLDLIEGVLHKGGAVGGTAAR